MRSNSHNLNVIVRAKADQWVSLPLDGRENQLSDGAQFIGSTAARIAWTALYTAVAAATAWFRFVTPARQAFRLGVSVF